MTGIVVKRGEQEFDDWLRGQHAKAAEMLEGFGLDPRQLLSTEVGWLLCLSRYEGKPLAFDLFQLSFLLDQSRKRSMNKARQIGFSFGIACESVARCHLKDRHTAVCVSYNLDDAKEKVARVKELHDELPLEYQKKMVIDAKTEVGFASNTSRRRISKVVSLPAKAPRGKTGDVYLDELAHCQNDRAIYVGATALITRSGGQLTIGSTPLGQRGIFHGVHTEAFDPYPDYTRFDVPWWLCRHFSRIVDRPDLVDLCETLPTEVRVERYGTQAIKDQFNALPIEDFQQEFELAFQDERVSFFPYDMILPCCQKEAWQIPVYDNLEQLAAVAHKLGPLYLGFDVGRTKHPSELTVFERQGPEYTMRYQEQWRDVPFPKQRARAKQIGRVLGEHWRKWRVDSTGLGKDLAETLQAEFGRRRVEQVDFSMATKERLANGLKILLQEVNVVLPKDRSIVSQIHSIKQKITAAGNAVFDAERNRRHHADKMWSIALATVDPKRRTGRRRVQAELRARVVGEGREELGRQAATRPTSFVERLFTTPEESAPPAAAPDGSYLSTLSPDELARLGRSLCAAGRVWARSGDEDKVRALNAEYRRVRREIQRRRTA